MSHKDFIDIIRSPRFAEQLKRCCNRCSYVSGHEGRNKAFEALKKRLDGMLKGRKERNRLFYMIFPPSVFVPMSEILKKHCYSERGESWTIVSLVQNNYTNTALY